MSWLESVSVGKCPKWVKVLVGKSLVGKCLVGKCLVGKCLVGKRPGTFKNFFAKRKKISLKTYSTSKMYIFVKGMKV